MNVPFLSGEYWYGGASHDGVKMPIGANDCYEIDCTKNETPNQMLPLFLSSKGRCLWAREGFHIRFNRFRLRRGVCWEKRRMKPFTAS